MTTQKTFSALALILPLSLTPVTAAACSLHATQAQSCAPGTAWDATLQACVKQANS